jgi:mRNA interferase YafQ
MLKIDNTTQFKRDLKRYRHDSSVLKELDSVIKRLTKLEPLDVHHRDHPLIGSWGSCRECHIKPDVLLIYRVQKMEGFLILERLGSHSELFS